METRSVIERCMPNSVSIILDSFYVGKRKTPVLESLDNKVAGLQLSCEYCAIFKNSFFHKTSPVAASEKFINFPGKQQWRRRNRFIFLVNTIVC